MAFESAVDGELDAGHVAGVGAGREGDGGGDLLGFGDRPQGIRAAKERPEYVDRCPEDATPGAEAISGVIAGNAAADVVVRPSAIPSMLETRG
ncbi:hypothetical protein [Streptomyces nondiastaticus]|uniref:Uncharacterized protein n=1 Tax=Streptomyces nondiastaticus TaxID=3154512 RepID=A0ABW6U4K9_9ACTN